LGVLLAGALACGGGGEAEGGEGGEGSSGGEHEDLSAFEGPVTGDSTAGAVVYENFCAGCHPGGGAGVGPELHNRTDSPAEIRALIRHGEDRMPAFGPDQISDADLENVLAYLTSFGMFQ
jgi:mono/diheme cytochrome c family protein